MDYTKAMQTVLENSYVLLAMFDRVGKEENIENRLDIAPAMTRAEQHLERIWRNKDAQFPDFQDVLDIATEAGKQIWNPREGDFLHRIAIRAMNDRAAAENWHKVEIENTPYINTEFIPSIHESVLEETHRIVDSQSLGNRSSRGVLAGAEALKKLGDLHNAVDQGDNEQMDYERWPLSGINTDFGGRVSFWAWLEHVGARQALPQAEVLEPVIREAKLTEKVANTTTESVGEAWKQERPEIPGQWVDQAVGALSLASVSPRMTDSDEPAEAVASLLAQAAKRQERVTDAYETMADNYVFTDRLNEARREMRSINEGLAGALEQVGELTARAGRPISMDFAVENMSSKDRARLEGLLNDQDQMLEQIDNLPERLEALAQAIREEQREEQAPGMQMG